MKLYRVVFTLATIFMASGALAKDTPREIKQALKSHDRAIHVTDGWIRDPYVILGADDYYYLTGTTPNENDPREESDYYNTGLGKGSIVGNTLRVWRSKDLVEWSYLGVKGGVGSNPLNYKNDGSVKSQPFWAPELHWNDTHWVLVHCPNAVSSLSLSKGLEFDGEWINKNPSNFKQMHDPSLFRDDDGRWYLIHNHQASEKQAYIGELNSDFSNFVDTPRPIDPSNRSIGHEGATMLRIGGKYVLFGTAWSTDGSRTGSYNLYYCTSDSINGPYSERRFAGRFLGHGTPFQDKKGQWWCTAFFNANVPPISDVDIESRDLSETAQTINQRGVTLVPLNVEIKEDGDVFINAIDPRYATPGPDEVGAFK